MTKTSPHLIQNPFYRRRFLIIIAVLLELTLTTAFAAENTPSTPATNATTNAIAPTTPATTVTSLVPKGDVAKYFPAPPYPYEAKSKGLEGTVTLSIDVKNGQITNVKVLTSSGHSVLDSATVDWITHHWKFPEQTTRTFSQPIHFGLTALK